MRVPERLQGRWFLLRLVTDARLSVTLASLRDEHTILDVLDYHEALDFRDEVDRGSAS